MARAEKGGNERSLPRGWRWVRFGDVVQNVNTIEGDAQAAGLERYVGLDHLDPESLRITRWGLVEEGTTFTRKFEKGQVLFAKRRAYQRKAAIADFGGLCSGDLLVFESKGELLPELLPFIVTTDEFFDHALRTSAGSLSPRTKWTELAKYEFALPPKTEQEDLATVLWSAERLEESRSRVVNCLHQVRASLASREAIHEAEAKVPLATVAEQITSGSRWWAKYYGVEGSIFLRITNLKRDSLSIDMSDVKRVTPPPGAEEVRTRVAADDLLISITADLGMVSVVPEGFPTAYVNQHIALVRLDRKRVDPLFVAQYLKSPAGQRQFHRMNNAGAKAGMNLKNVGKLMIPLPDIETQSQVVDLVKRAEHVLKLSQEQGGLESILRKRVLNRLLTARSAV